MNAKLDTLILYVKNTELLKNFYVENFNLKVIEEDHIWVLLNAGSANIGLHKIGYEYLQQIDPAHTFDNNTKIVFEIDTDIETARKELMAKKVQVREMRTFDHYPFWLCDGTDPEGNVFQLKSRK
ncbi:VOC family protein [Chryseobacterium sp. Mn2064]|uniref:VOC family protein n=1 Tax=Chryseobacterium sp. Mn2064 TaxID=3395263 RepID=UPI003BE8391A